ncbi:MAG: polyphosphate polymerase domain-containing protein [Oscillospiraceae bacterium]|nr:polyphosphate polymerase domain-containing protein [Oscillospiraceae bacterium]
MAVEVFNRYEKKYVLDADTYERVIRRVSEYAEPDEHNKAGRLYEIRNVYYDTRDSALIRRSLSKPHYKEKLRLRSYGEPKAGDMVYAEIKKKAGGLVNKRRSAMYPREAERFLGGGGIELAPYMNAQVVGEIGYMLESAGERLSPLRPAAYLAYDREAFFGIGRHDVRVSFDTNIRTRRDDLTLDRDGGEPLLEPGLRIMEIKAARSIPLWLCGLLSEYKIYPMGFSKYGAEYINSHERISKARCKSHARPLSPAKG